MNKVAYLASTLLHLQLPILKNTVFFQSFHGQYNDNPKYISEALHRRRPDIKIVWAIKDGQPKTFPEYAELVHIDSLAYTKYISRAQVVVDNYLGCRSSFLKENNILKRAIYRLRARHRIGQLCISTWHGSPLKHIAMDEPQYKKAPFSAVYSNTDVLLANDQPTANAFRTAFQWNKSFFTVGAPRNDLLFSNENTKKILKDKLGLSLDKRYVLFAPTFRNNVQMSGLYQLQQLDIRSLCSALSEALGGQWEFIFRSHNEVMKAIGQSKQIDESQIINGNRFEDMAEYLLCADALITDYSGCMLDYAITKKPCFLYTPDIDNYGSVERGFYEDISDLPFPQTADAKTLIEKIRNFDAASYENAITEMLEKRGVVDCGSAAQQVVDEIEKHLG